MTKKVFYFLLMAVLCLQVYAQSSREYRPGEEITPFLLKVKAVHSSGCVLSRVIEFQPYYRIPLDDMSIIAGSIVFLQQNEESSVRIRCIGVNDRRAILEIVPIVKDSWKSVNEFYIGDRLIPTLTVISFSSNQVEILRHFVEDNTFDVIKVGIGNPTTTLDGRGKEVTIRFIGINTIKGVISLEVR